MQGVQGKSYHLSAALLANVLVTGKSLHIALDHMQLSVLAKRIEVKS